jgi:hypothetical protein
VTLQELRALAERLPPGWPVTLPREALLEALADLQSGNGAVLTVAQIADRLHRTASTVRSWLEAGLFPGAFHLPSSGKVMTFSRGRAKGRQRATVGAWRVPTSAFEAFVNGQREDPAPALRAVPRRSEKSRPRVRREATSLGDWRSEAVRKV